MTQSGELSDAFTQIGTDVKKVSEKLSYDAISSRALAHLNQPIAWAKRNGVNLLIGEVGIPANIDGTKYDVRYETALRVWMERAKEAKVPFQIWGSSEWASDLRAYAPAPGTSDILSITTSVGTILEEYLRYHRLNGTNLSGADFGQNGFTLNPRPGVVGTNYDYPSEETFRFLASRGIKVVRFPFRWERLQPTLGAAFDGAEQGRFTTVLDNAAKYGVAVIADMHNYGAYATSSTAYSLLGDAAPTNSAGYTTMTEAFVGFWTRFATLYKSHAGLEGYGLLNEPHDLTGGGNTWRDASSKAAYAIFDIDKLKKIFISGYFYATCTGWEDQNGATPWLYDYRGTAAPLSVHPNIWFEGHMYFDPNGRYEISYADNLAAAVASGFTAGSTTRAIPGGAMGQLGAGVQGPIGPAGTSLNTVVIPKGSTDIPNGTAPNSVVIRLTS